MSKHTRGPWQWRAGRDLSQEGTGNPVLVAKIFPEPSDANAALIAAAPDLLEAAYSAVGLIRGSGFTDNTKALRELLAAIAKAEGR